MQLKQDCQARSPAKLTIEKKLTPLQRRNAELVIRDRVCKLIRQLGKLDTVQGLGRVLASNDMLLDGWWEICLVLRTTSIGASDGLWRGL